MPLEFLHPQLDFIPDPSDDRYYFCPNCEFFCGKDRLEELQAHLESHGVPVNSTNAIPVHEIAGALTGNVIKAPRVYTCKDCGEKFTGYGNFMAHKRAHKRPGFIATLKRIVEG